MLTSISCFIFSWLFAVSLCAIDSVIQVNDPKGDYRHILGAQPLSEEQWTLRVNTAVYGTDFVAFFATDNNR